LAAGSAVAGVALSRPKLGELSGGDPGIIARQGYFNDAPADSIIAFALP